MKIKAKLQTMALLPLLVFLAASAIEYWAYLGRESLYARGEVAMDASHATHHLISLGYEYGTNKSERAASQWQNQYAELQRFIRNMESVFDDPAEQPMLADMLRYAQNSGNLFAELLAFDRRLAENTGAAQFMVVRHNLFNRLILELQSLAPLTARMHAATDANLKKFIRYRLLLTFAILLALVLSLLALASWINNGINSSLSRLRQGIQTVAGGDLACRLNLESRDELGELSRGFDEMTEKLAAVTVSRDALSQEMAERHLAEEVLSAREAQLKEAQRLAQLGSWELDLTSGALFWSDEIYRIFEIDPMFLGATYEAFLKGIHPEDREMVNQAYTASLQTKTPYEIEHRLLMPDGRIKYVHERCETNFDSNGTPLRSRGTVQDISARRQAEEEIRKLNEELERRVTTRTQALEEKSLEVEEIQRALMNIVEDLNHKTTELVAANFKLQDVDRLKSLFIASMSHELRTPLNSIIGFSSIVLDEWLGPLNDAQKEKLAIVLRTGKHLLALINDLIDISKIEAGKLEGIPAEFDLFDLITEAAGISAADIAAKGLALEVEAIHLTMHSDRQRLYQCVINLLANAAKFTRQGTITIKALQEREREGPQERKMVAISIRDTGIGIKEEDLPKLFSSFVRLTLPEDMQVKGTGLGLYLVKKIATEILAGGVSVTSVPGQGSEFCLTVPIRLEKS